jgi:hypothetical protein
MRVLGESAIGEVRFGDRPLEFDDSNKEELKQFVSIQAARDFYHHLYADDKPWAAAPRLMNQIGKVLPEDALVIDRKKQLVAIKREAWDQEISAYFSGTSQLKLGPETRKFLEAFNSYLPPFEKTKKARIHR